MVCEMSSNFLTLFDPQGNKIHTVGSLNEPREVILNRISGSLYVGNYGASA